MDSLLRVSNPAIEYARGMREQLREHAAAADEQRRLHPDDVADMKAAGLMSLWAPAAVGGAEASVRTVADVSRALGQGDATAGWVASVSNACTFVLSLFGDDAKAEVWPDARHVSGAGVLAAAGESEAATGGVRVSGRWPYMSGVTVADWILVTAPVDGSLGPGAELAFVLVPRSDVTIDDTWFVTGMRATASSTAVLDRVFVPEHRLLRWSDYRRTDYEGLYRLPVHASLSMSLVGTMVGEAEHALEYVLGKASRRSIATTSYRAQTDSVAFQLEVARAEQLLESARLRLANAADQLDAIVADGRRATAEEQTRNRADCAFIADACWQATDALASAHGTSTFAQGTPLERMWRNAAVGSRHGGLSARVADELLGRSMLGLETHSISPAM